MKKKWKRSKNRILVGLLAFLSLFYQIVPTVEARTILVENNYNFSNIFPSVRGGLDETIFVEQNYEELVATGTTYTPDYYYLFYFFQPYTLDANFRYDVTDKDYVTSQMYVKYGGETYLFNNEYLSFVATGANTGTFSIGVDVDIQLEPYWSSDGYIYANTCQVDYSTHDVSWANARYYVARLEASEVAEAKQLVYILEYLSNSPDINGEHSSSIIIKLTDIMNDTASIKGKLNSLYDLLVEVYGQDEADKVVMDNFQENSSSQSSELGQLNQENQVEKIDIDSASLTVDTNIDMNAIGNSGVVLSALTGENKILVMMLGVSAIALVAYVFFGKR